MATDKEILKEYRNIQEEIVEKLSHLNDVGLLDDQAAIRCEGQEYELNLFVGAALTIKEAEKIRSIAFKRIMKVHKHSFAFADEPTISWFDIEENQTGKLNDDWKEGVDAL